MLLLAIVVQPSAQHCRVTRCSQRTNKFSKVKDHRRRIATALRLHGFSVQRTMNWKLKCCYLEVVTEPPMDLPISKLNWPYRLAWHGSNKAATLSLNWHWFGSLMDRFQVYHVDGWGFASWLGALRFRKWMLARFNSWDQFFFTFFKTFQTFPFGVRFRG